ncbi:replication initiation/membrane attachment protein [Streptococcus gallolyticus]|nr:replication initiation/membrane attachment protein [Streptococcus gallolyticus]MBY5040192.1 replication initiation/membrane attachment protein [Streptococcus gallolyticus]
MKPNDTYAYLAGQQMTPDFASLAVCYQPILGLEATALYHYLWSFYDNGAGRYKFSRVLNHLGLGTQAVEAAMDLLSAMKLLDVYQVDEEVRLQVLPPLSKQEFLKHTLYHSLLVKKIGEPAVQLLSQDLPAIEQKITKQFSDVFSMEGQVQISIKALKDFDMVSFKQLMARDYLRFHDEQADTLALHHLSEKAGWTWFEAYQVAKETAIDFVISTKRMEQKVQNKPVSKGQFSSQELSLIQESKKHKPVDFLQLLKNSRKAAMTATERTCLKEMAQLGLLDEVINAIVLYTYNRVDSANLNEKYALKVANDFSYRGINSAEAAVLALREGTKPVKPNSKTPTSSNVPEWSKKEVKQEKTAQDQEKLEALRRQMLGQESKGGDL